MPLGAKKELRARLRAQRLTIAAARDRFSDGKSLAAHASQLAASMDLTPGTYVTVYESWPHEPPTERLINALRDLGLQPIAPITEPDWDLDWCLAGDGLRARLGREAIGTAGLLLVPALAVDTHGVRLGQGGGCYDRALRRAAPGVRIVAILHPGERREADLPADELDVPVHGTLTADGLQWLPGQEP